MTFSGDVICFYIIPAHAKNTNAQGIRERERGREPRIMCFAETSKAAIPFSPSIPQFICKLHVSCYLWRDSRELCDLSSSSLIIAVMRIKALERAPLVGSLIHMHEGGKSQSLLCHPSFTPRRDQMGCNKHLRWAVGASWAVSRQMCAT